MKQNKLLKITLGSILLLLVLTNPSLKDFNSYLHNINSQRTGRDYNFIICSMYSKNGLSDTRKNSYFAILGNFFPVGKHFNTEELDF